MPRSADPPGSASPRAQAWSTPSSSSPLRTPSDLGSRRCGALSEPPRPWWRCTDSQRAEPGSPRRSRRASAQRTRRRCRWGRTHPPCSRFGSSPAAMRGSPTQTAGTGTGATLQHVPLALLLPAMAEPPSLRGGRRLPPMDTPGTDAGSLRCRARCGPGEGNEGEEQANGESARNRRKAQDREPPRGSPPTPHPPRLDRARRMEVAACCEFFGRSPPDSPGLHFPPSFPQEMGRARAGGYRDAWGRTSAPCRQGRVGPGQAAPAGRSSGPRRARWGGFTLTCTSVRGQRLATAEPNSEVWRTALRFPRRAPSRPAPPRARRSPGDCPWDRSPESRACPRGDPPAPS